MMIQLLLRGPDSVCTEMQIIERDLKRAGEVKASHERLA